MSFDDLPDICLWKILENFHEVRELIQLSKVCSRWSDLITPRFNRVKYLQASDRKTDYIDENSLWITCETDLVDYNIMESFPNLKIIEVTSCSGFILQYILAKIINTNPKIKGLIGLSNLTGRKLKYLYENIEMCDVAYLFDYKKVFRPDQLKQISNFYFNMVDLPSLIEYFPNLKRINLTELADVVERYYNGPKLFALKMLESQLIGTATFKGFHFIDFCPSLESAFFSYEASDTSFDDSIKNFNLRDLVIEYVSLLPWSSLRRILSKFPNLHHLGLRGIDGMEDRYVEELVKLLPELKILDLRTCKKITQKSANFLSQYCIKTNRSIVIYYNCENEPVGWPKLASTRESICCGFDFMKHCFYKDFDCLPILIDE